MNDNQTATSSSPLDAQSSQRIRPSRTGFMGFFAGMTRSGGFDQQQIQNVRQKKRDIGTLGEDAGDAGGHTAKVARVESGDGASQDASAAASNLRSVLLRHAQSTEATLQQLKKTAGQALPRIFVDLTQDDDTDGETAQSKSTTTAGKQSEAEMQVEDDEQAETEWEDAVETQEAGNIAKTSRQEEAESSTGDEAITEVPARECQRCGEALPPPLSAKASTFKPCGHHELCTACMGDYLAYKDGRIKKCWSCAQPIRVLFEQID